MRKLIQLACVLLPIIYSGHSYSQIHPSNTIFGFMQICKEQKRKSEHDLMSWIRCREYINGLFDMLTLNSTQMRDGDRLKRAFAICNVPNVNDGTLALVFVNWAERHPEKWKEYKILMIEAFTEMWPCTK